MTGYIFGVLRYKINELGVGRTMATKKNLWETMTRPPFNPRAEVCWLSGLRDQDGVAGTIDRAHIVDEVLLGPRDDEARYSPHNTLRMHATLHRVWDARQMTIHPDGSITTALQDSDLTKLGISRKSRLPPECLTERRVAFLKARCNGWNEFVLQSQAAKASRRGLS